MPQHFSTILKYTGISFITGAIAHGFFSESRQIWTALFGILCFIIGTLLEKDTEKNMKNIILSMGLAISLGAITGGLQHFPDSPERSVWILPLGVIFSLPLYVSIHKEKLSRLYITILTLGSLALAVGLYFLLEATSFLGTHGHGDIDTHISQESQNPVQDTHPEPGH